MGDVPQPGKWFPFQLIGALLLGGLILGGAGFALAEGLGTFPAFNEKRIQVCERDNDKLIVVIEEKDFDAKVYSKNLDDCK